MRNRIGVIAAILLLAAIAVASRESAALPQGSPERRAIKLPANDPKLPFSDGILVGNTLYIAGKIGIDPKTNKPPEDVEQEARLALNGVKATLEAAGMSMDDLVTVTVYCPDLSLYDKFNGVYRTYFKGDFPARAFIGSGTLLRGGRFEIQSIAVGKAKAQLMPAKQ